MEVAIRFVYCALRRARLPVIQVESTSQDLPFEQFASFSGFEQLTVRGHENLAPLQDSDKTKLFIELGSCNSPRQGAYFNTRFSFFRGTRGESPS